MRHLWYTLSMTLAAFLVGIGVGAYSGISTTVLNGLRYGTFVGLIISFVAYLWVTRRRC